MRILLVEDEKLIADDIAAGLKAAGYVVDISYDGEDAWFRGETEDYDAIILDLGLPRLDGLSVLKRLRKAGVDTPVLILTARGAWMERVEGIDAGADDYLPKPFHFEELAARLGSILRRKQGHASSVIAAGPLRLDTRRMVADVEGKALPLSPLEFRLLRYLVHNKGHVVSQSQLIEHVYDGDHEPDSNAIEVLVGRVRRKVGSDLIQTKRGFGYVVSG
jgi:DNA-binding response OmpR family regulator